jgi:DNA repair protein RecN (Recombination protein N)
MIVELSVENLAIIEQSTLKLGPGFTALTGETGAGKSLLIDAINLALGDRADTDLVRMGASRASVSVVFDLGNNPETLAKCQELGFAMEDSMLYIAREVLAEGRSQCRVGGKLTPVSSLKQLGALLVDLHGQHDHQSLMQQERHLGFLDDWIGQPAHQARGLVEAAYVTVDHARKRLSALRSGLRDREHRLDLLRFQVKEIEDVSPAAGEFEELEARLSRLQNAEKLATAAFGALESVSDQESSAIELLAVGVKSLEDVLRFDASLEEMLSPLRVALIEAKESAHAIRAYAESMESDPAELDLVASRIDALKRLRRKYGESEAQVLAFLDDARHELALLEDSEGSETDLVQAVADAQKLLEADCSLLTALRIDRAKEFGALVEAQLRDLAMERAQFAVDIQPKIPEADGADRIELFFSANVGEPPRPLAKIASGGEISRVMLAIKTAMAGRAGVPTLIFDEVDTGLGGRAAATVARKLGELAQHYQVLVISHLPQIASRATTQFQIEKSTESGRVRTGVRQLTESDRVHEIARMLAGDHVTESAIANARELLSKAQ